MSETPTPVELTMCFGIPKAHASILRLLMSGGVVTDEMVRDELDMDTPTRILVHRLRGMLGEHTIKVESRRNVGYWLGPEDMGKAWEKWRSYSGKLNARTTA